MAAEWTNFKAKMKAKRIDKGKGKKKDTISSFNDENDTLVVQRLSAEVSGKAQKYSRIGAREFVSYEYEEFTIENIRRACEKHFAVDKSMSCDILAGERGPSCNTVKQIPDSRVIHARFVTGDPNSRCEGRVKCNLHNICDVPVSRYRPFIERRKE